MAKYRKADNCGPVPYPDQSGRYLGEGEVVEDDEANDWAPLVTLGFVVETDSAPTPDKQETAAELANAVDTSKEAKPSEKEAPVEESSPKKKRGRKKSKKSEEVNDGMQSADDGAGAEEVDSSEARESDS